MTTRAVLQGCARFPLRACRERWPIGVVIAAAVAATGCLGLAPVRPDAPPGRFRERVVVLVVDGTPGLPFEGSYGTPTVTQSVRGSVPAQFHVRSAVAVTATFTKAAAEGELIVRLVVDGQEVARRQTSQPFGTVMLSRVLAR